MSEFYEMPQAKPPVPVLDPTQMLPIDQVVSMEGLGSERIRHIHGSTFQDTSTVIIVPTRGMIHYRVVQTWQTLITPMNGKRNFFFASGHEVGTAYNEVISFVLQHPELSKWKYVMTLEDDNLQPPDAQIKLIETLTSGGFDAVSGIYFTKGEINMPMAYGNAVEYATQGILDFKPIDIHKALCQEPRPDVMEVNGIAMGCSLYRMDLFREVPGPWFVTKNSWDPTLGISCMTQDLSFCEKAKRMGKRFAVDFRVKVGHLDVNSGVVY